MSDWLTALVDQHIELESPKSFWKWAALAAISAVVKDQIWMDRQIYNLYPNIYVMLHAESGLKKGPPISMAKQLVKPVNNTQIISGRSSIQGILKQLGTAQTVPGGKIQQNSVAFICSSELSSSIVDDKVATTILTDLYDRQYNTGQWQSLLKMETFSLNNPTITMLTATNEAMSEDFFTRSAIQGGYFARTFIVYEKESQVSNSLVYPLLNPPNYVLSSDYLKELSKLKGVFKSIAQIERTDEYRFRKTKAGRDIWFNSIGILYDDWYDTFKEMVKTQEIKDQTGTLNRFGDSVLKVAMLYSLALSPTLEILEESMLAAIGECERLVGSARKVTFGKQGTSNQAQLKTLVITTLLERDTHQITRAMLMKQTWMHYASSEEFDGMMLGLDASGIITTSAMGNQILYSMSEKVAQEYIRFLSGKG